MSDKHTGLADPDADATVTANAAVFQLPNGISMVGIFHIQCDCQPTSSLAAPVNLKSMKAVCRFCGMVYKVEKLSLTANIHGGSSQVN